jgi:hypothetical protein
MDESGDLTRSARVDSVKLINFGFGVHKILGRFSSVFTFSVAFPTDEVFQSATKDFGVSYMVNFVLLLAVYCNRFGWWGL